VRTTFHLGRILGVRVGVHWSVLVIFAIIALGLAEGRLPQAHPGLPPILYWVAGVTAALLFLLSLLAHELAHAVMARREGAAIDDVVLWLLGGFARLRTKGHDPAAELRIAGVGPLVSLVAAGVFAALASAFAFGGAPVLITEVAAWLAAINLFLALFNVLPAAPLDGGRLLRALVWWRTGDWHKAAKIATTAGRAFGWLLVLAGAAVLLAGGSLGGLWLAIVGWFLIMAATAEARQVQPRDLMNGVTVSEAMTKDVVTVSADLTIAQFLRDRGELTRHPAFPVLDGSGRPVGLLTVRAARSYHRSRDLEQLTARDIMIPIGVCAQAHPGTLLTDLLPALQTQAGHRILVTQDDRLVGIVSPSDISRTVTLLRLTKMSGRGTQT
jgi:Zn-dependent protease/CBS domain-containing protein